MKLAEINPYIRHAERSALPPAWQINRRIILDYEIIYIESGRFQLTCGHSTYSCKTGDVIFLCPNIPHACASDQGVVQPHIHFDFKYDTDSEQVFICFRDYPDLSAPEQRLIRENLFPQFSHAPLLKFRDKAAFLELFYKVIDAPNHQSLSCKATMLALLEMLLFDNAPNALEQIPETTPIALQVKEFLDANYCQDISLSTLEMQFSYSKFYIEKCFKKEYGLSVMQYRSQKRMAAALTLLKDHSVSETGQLLGYSSIYTFSQAFSAYYGVSPAKYFVNGPHLT